MVNPKRMTGPKTTGAPLDRLAQLLAGAERLVVFTGAGVSTESGIPDFRSPGGVWSRMQPIYFSDFVASQAARRESWRRCFESTHGLTGAAPNRGHQAIARLVAAGKVAAVITQNVDNLHQASGVPDAKVIELHGNAGYASCLNCNQRYELADLAPVYRAEGGIGACRGCGGLIKTATISFGQPMPREAMERAEHESLACDLFIAAGSSLEVYPAAGFPERAKRNGARLVILNREPTPFDGVADLVLHAEIGATLAAAVENALE